MMSIRWRAYSTARTKSDISEDDDSADGLEPGVDYWRELTQGPQLVDRASLSNAYPR